MTITISINSSSGVNVNHGGSNYLDTVNDNFDSMTGRFGYFYNSFVNASQYGLATSDSDSDGVIDDGNAFIAGGNMTYNLMTNTLSGSIDTLAFGNNISGIASVTPGITTGAMSFTGANNPAFTITSLGITGTTQTDDTHEILFGLMNGDETLLEAYLGSHAVILQGNNGSDAYQAGSQADTLNGNNGNDSLAGGGGADSISGGDMNDSLLGEAGIDTIDAGNGADTVNGGANNDSITGGENNDSLLGSAGADTVGGGGGVDTVNGGAGADQLGGGAGDDRFVFASGAEANGDTISSFVSGDDQIDLGWAFTWNATANDPGEVFFSGGALHGEDASGVAFSITVSSGTVLQTDLI